MLRVVVALLGLLWGPHAFAVATAAYCLNQGRDVVVPTGDKEIWSNAPDGTVLATLTAVAPFTVTPTCTQALDERPSDIAVYTYFPTQLQSVRGRDCYQSSTPGICFRVTDPHTGQSLVPLVVNGGVQSIYNYETPVQGFVDCGRNCLQSPTAYQPLSVRRNETYALSVELVKYGHIPPGLITPFPGRLFHYAIELKGAPNANFIEVFGQGTLRAVERGCGLQPDSFMPVVDFKTVANRGQPVGTLMKPAKSFTLNFKCAEPVLPKVRFDHHPEDPPGGAGFLPDDFALYTRGAAEHALNGLAFQIDNGLNGQVMQPGVAADYAASGGVASATPGWPFSVRLLKRLPTVRPGPFAGRAIITLLQP